MLASGNITINDNVALTSISLPELASAGDVFIQNNVTLTGISLPVLASAGDITIRSNPALASLSLPMLASASVVISDNPLLTSCTGALIVPVGDCVEP